MKLLVDIDNKFLTIESEENTKKVDLYSKEAFEIISDQWIKIGWNEKYMYTFTWLGRPIIQLPEDMIRMQEVIYNLRPDVIVETGIAHGGSLVFYASICKMMERGRVIGVDVEIKPQNKKAIEEHILSNYITLIEGDSVAEDIVSQVKDLIKANERVLVILDSCHSKEHVLKELEAYSNLVNAGSYIVATDGVMRSLYEVPRGAKEWIFDNPYEAALEFTESHKEFVIEQPKWLFNESKLEKNITHWPGAWIKRL
jgi:cephalosporin hydroxylase